MGRLSRNEQKPPVSILKIVRRGRVAPAPRSRVRFIVYLGEMLKIKVRVDLRGRDAGMAQEILDRPQITA